MSVSPTKEALFRHRLRLRPPMVPRHLLRLHLPPPTDHLRLLRPRLRLVMGDKEYERYATDGLSEKGI